PTGFVVGVAGFSSGAAEASPAPVGSGGTSVGVATGLGAGVAPGSKRGLIPAGLAAGVADVGLSAALGSLSITAFGGSTTSSKKSLRRRLNQYFLVWSKLFSLIWA